MTKTEQIDFGGLTVYVDYEEHQRVLDTIAPMLISIKKLRETVSDCFPHWLNDKLKPWHGQNDYAIRDEYLRITEFIESLCPRLISGIQGRNIEELGMVSYDLLVGNADPRYCIRLGRVTTMMNPEASNQLGLACSESLFNPNADILGPSLVNAMSDVINRLQKYIDPSV